MKSALSYFPTTRQIRSCVSLRDKVSMVSDLFMLFLCYPFYHVKGLRGIPILIYRAMRDYRIKARGVIFVVPGNCPPENTYINEDYEPEVKAIIENFHGGVFVDAGAGIGLYALTASRNVGRVLALEPNGEMCSRLFMAKMQNPYLLNITIGRIAAWNKSGSAKLYSHPLVRFGSSLKEGSKPEKYSDHFEIVATREIDALMPEGSPVLMKLDVEGSEPEAMVGALKTLLRKDVMVIFEALSQEALERSKRVIEPLGYVVTRLSERDYLGKRP